MRIKVNFARLVTKTEAIIIGDIHERFAIKKDKDSKGDSDTGGEEKKSNIIEV